MRKKTGKPMDAAAINLAWEDLFNQNKIHSIDELRNIGWISIYEASERMGRSRMAAKAALQKLGAEYKLFVIIVNGLPKRTGFFKLKS